ncbi:MAG: Clp protease N-terminal domain-containing protein [Actinomycetota bacterium]
MFERFTDEARGVVQRAFAEASALRTGSVGTEHVLLALLDPAAGSAASLLSEMGVEKLEVYADIAQLEGPLPGLLDKADAAALESIGIDLDAVLGRIEATFGPLAPPVRRRSGWFGRRRQERRGADCLEGRPRFSARSKKVLELSLREALRLKHNAIGAEHILLGLIREGEGLAAKILVNAGVDLAELRRRTESALARAA